NGTDQLIDGIKFLGLGEMRQVAGMQEKGRLAAGVDSADRFLHGADDVLVRLLGEADVAVGKLDEGEIGVEGFSAVGGIGLHGAPGKEAALHGPEDAGAGPGHAAEKAPAVNAVGGT